MPLRGRGGEGGRHGRWGLDSLGRSDPVRRAPAAPHPAACSSQSSARSLHGAPLGERQLNGHCTRAHIIESGIGPGTDSGLVCAWERAWARRNPRRRRGERATPPPSSAAAPAAPRSAATPARGRAARSARNGPRRRRSEKRTSARRGAAAATAARIRATRRPQKCARCARRPRAPPRTAAYGAHSRARAAATGHPRRHPAAPSPAQRRTNHPIAHAVNHLYPPVSSPCDLAWPPRLPALAAAHQQRRDAAQPSLPPCLPSVLPSVPHALDRGEARRCLEHSTHALRLSPATAPLIFPRSPRLRPAARLLARPCAVPTRAIRRACQEWR